MIEKQIDETPEAQGEVEGMSSLGAACPICGLPHEEWEENAGKGIVIGELTYCSQTCADKAEK